jgi:uncharacterized protein (TIGR02217 family)
MRQLYRLGNEPGVFVDVTKPVPNDNTLSVALGGSEVTNYSVDTLTGIITFTTAIATTTNVRVKGMYHIPVRFDTDAFEPSEDELGFWTWPDIPLLEVRV